ncbi:MAG: N-(5'-phosphoribosyl)anthranilate isomerase, partial [Sphingomonadales bacterium]|nr:N-(5'-phosphoribosyl)anthranilate isomerase [Sphingomonadales bacterium]
MPAPKIKICGISTPAALDACIAAQADYCGFVFFPPSPRNVTPSEAADLAARAAGRIARVGLFVDADDLAIGEAIRAGSLDALQLHGSEPPERVAAVGSRFGLPVWKALPVSNAADVTRALAYRGAADLVLFDARTPRGAS